jgi:copper(I)-binding protein
MKTTPWTRRVFLVLASTLAMSATAHDFRVKDLVINHPWARATVPGQKAGGAFLTIENRGTQNDRLLSAKAPADRVGHTELHTMSMEGNVMRMREVAAIEVPAGQTVKLEPGGLHLMLMGLSSPLKAGEKLPVVLTFEKAGEVTVEVRVEAVSSAPAKGHGSGAQHKH